MYAYVCVFACACARACACVHINGVLSVTVIVVANDIGDPFSHP